MELSKQENLKLYVEGWKAGASGNNRRIDGGPYAAGFQDGYQARIAAQNAAIRTYDITATDLIEAVLR